MRYKIENETESPDREVTLRFEREPNGAVNVMADDWYILSFEPDGSIKLCGAVPSQLGFKVDKGGHVRTNREQ